MNIYDYNIRIETIGCRLNQVESEAFADLCTGAGFSLYTGSHSGSEEQTILCFINSCTVTGKAEQKARRLIRLLVKTHPNAVILVTGCYAQLNAETIETLHPHVIAFPGRQKDSLIEFPAFLSELFRCSPCADPALLLAKIRAYTAHITTAAQWTRVQKQPFFALSSSRFFFHSRALLKIQDGCNASCSYCRIRLARGKSISLPAEEVIRRLHRIEQAGSPEVTLSGVNLSHYHSEVGDFAGILKLILDNSRIRIRISSLYPDRIDEELLPLLAHPRICPHFHLSVQSGSNAVLKAMQRSYTRETVYKAVFELRKMKVNPFIGVDIITGFPGESNSDFDETYRMCKELAFAGIHAFPFSARPGTAAWNMQPKIPEREAGLRVRELISLAEQQQYAYRMSWDGKIVYGVTEMTHNHQCTVITENYLSLQLINKTMPTGAPLHGGEYVQVRVCGNFAQLL